MALSDWDWGFSSSYRSLSSVWKISSPTSLKLTGPIPAADYAVLCRKDNVLNVPEGEIRTWFNRVSSEQLNVFFRNQSALGVANYQNSYYLYGLAGVWNLERWVNNVKTTIGTFGVNIPVGEVRHVRFVWWNGENLQGTPCLSLAAFMENGQGEWELQATIYDTVNQWKDSDINRCGCSAKVATAQYCYLDDTEIWIPA